VTCVVDEGLIGRGLSKASAESEIPRAQWSCDGDSARRPEPRSQVRDRESKEVISDAECGKLLGLRRRLVPRRNIQTGREDDEVRAEAPVRPHLRIGESTHTTLLRANATVRLDARVDVCRADIEAQR